MLLARYLHLAKGIPYYFFSNTIVLNMKQTEWNVFDLPGRGCSKLKTMLVNVLLKFHTLIS